MIARVKWWVLSAVTVGSCGGDPAMVGTPYADAVESYAPGSNGGLGADRLPDVVLGPPHGTGTARGDTDDVLSLGRGGSIVLELGVEVVDGPGTDLRVFENAFYAGGVMTTPFAEPGIVSVSDDGVSFTEFPCAAAPPWTGCAGVTPVLSSPANGIDPRSDAAGGDAFDLATIGVARARYVRIVDSGLGPMGAPPTDGFDLDAVAVVHAE